MDRPLTAWQRAIPEQLMRALDEVTVDGHPLVDRSCTAFTGRFGWAPPPAGLGPLGVLPGGLVAVGALWAAARADEPRRRRQAGALVAAWGTVLGLLGTVTLALWAVSDLHGLGPTEGWLLAGRSPGCSPPRAWPWSAARCPPSAAPPTPWPPWGSPPSPSTCCRGPPRQRRRHPRPPAGPPRRRGGPVASTPSTAVKPAESGGPGSRC
ncbi:MAG: hypothetical protein R3F59_25055 [Myxococcota bacterium]